MYSQPDIDGSMSLLQGQISVLNTSLMCQAIEQSVGFRSGYQITVTIVSVVSFLPISVAVRVDPVFLALSAVRSDFVLNDGAVVTSSFRPA